MSTVLDLDAFDALSTAEQLSLVRTLWDRIEGGEGVLPVPSAHQELLAERLNEHRASPNEVVPWRQLHDRIRNT